MTGISRPGAGLTSWCVALCLAAAACSGGSAGSGAQRHRPPRATEPAAAQPSAGPAAAAAVKALWLEFFNGAVPIPTRLRLLQDGQAFAPFVRSQERTQIGALVLEASAAVSSVVVGTGTAAVTYTILLGGKPLAKGLHGTAVYQGGRWRVGARTFCGLLRLAYGKAGRAIPAACGG